MGGRSDAPGTGAPAATAAMSLPGMAPDGSGNGSPREKEPEG
jgi:hypothetical protein